MPVLPKSIWMINLHGRKVQVLEHRKETLLKAGYTLAPEAKPAGTPAPKAEEPKEPEAPKGDEGGGDDDTVQPGLTPEEYAAELEDLTKPELVEYADEELGLELSVHNNKDKLIAAIVEAALQ